MEKERIQSEAQRCAQEIWALQEPNSPMGTHYHAKLSEQFCLDAGSRDYEILGTKLARLLKSPEISGYKKETGLKGLYVITKTNEPPQSIQSRIEGLKAASAPAVPKTNGPEL